MGSRKLYQYTFVPVTLKSPICLVLLYLYLLPKHDSVTHCAFGKDRFTELWDLNVDTFYYPVSIITFMNITGDLIRSLWGRY